MSEPTTGDDAFAAHEQSSKHGAHQDESLRHDTGDSEWVGSAGVPEDRRGTPAGMSQDDVETRSRIAQALGPQAFPGDRDSLLDTATDNSADDRVIDLLERLPQDRTYENVQDVARTLGLHVETMRN